MMKNKNKREQQDRIDQAIKLLQVATLRLQEVKDDLDTKDIEILEPGYRKLQRKTGLPIFGTIPMTKFEIPDEDSIGNSPKNLNWNATNLKKLDIEINKIAKVVKSSLNIPQVEKLLK